MLANYAKDSENYAKDSANYAKDSPIMPHMFDPETSS